MDSGDAQSSWHALLDALAIERGHRDNLALAQALCDLNGNSSLTAFDTAVKNLRNWRAGHHVPQRRNYLLLSHLLDIDNLGPDRRQAWEDAYKLARRTRDENGPSVLTPVRAGDERFPRTASRSAPPGGLAARLLHRAGAAPAKSGEPRQGAFRLIFATGLLSGILVGFLSGIVIGIVFVPQAIRPAFALSPGFASVNGGPETAITVHPGQSIVIASVSAPGCDVEPPSWEDTAPSLPELSTGRLSDGGPGTRYEPDCGMRVGARAIAFSAEGPGEDRFLIGGKPIRLRVF